jgi:hypothetical protein
LDALLSSGTDDALAQETQDLLDGELDPGDFGSDTLLSTYANADDRDGTPGDVGDGILQALGHVGRDDNRDYDERYSHLIRHEIPQEYKDQLTDVHLGASPEAAFAVRSLDGAGSYLRTENVMHVIEVSKQDPESGYESDDDRECCCSDPTRRFMRV